MTKGPEWVGASNPVARMAMLTTHYNRVMDWKPDTLQNAEQAWKKLWSIAEPCDDDVPDEIVRAMADDMNTPSAIAHMLTFAQKRDGRKVYASLKFLGLLPAEN